MARCSALDRAEMYVDGALFSMGPLSSENRRQGPGILESNDIGIPAPLKSLLIHPAKEGMQTFFSGAFLLKEQPKRVPINVGSIQKWCHFNHI